MGECALLGSEAGTLSSYAASSPHPSYRLCRRSVLCLLQGSCPRLRARSYSRITTCPAACGSFAQQLFEPFDALHSCSCYPRCCCGPRSWRAWPLRALRLATETSRPSRSAGVRCAATAADQKSCWVRLLAPRVATNAAEAGTQ